MKGPKRLPRKLAAIFYADVAGYSRLTGEDEDETHHRLSRYLDVISSAIARHRGRVMHYAGDAVLAMFGAVLDALACAAEIQRDLKARNEDLPDERKVQFRIGVNLGDVIEDRSDIYGDGVNVAARLESLAEPGEICISESVRIAVGNKLPLVYDFLGERRVKNIDEPIRVYRVSVDSGVRENLGPRGQPPPKPSDKPSIAVLAFANMSGDPDQEYFSDGITEDIITDLSKVSALFVVARNSTFVLKGRAIDIKEVSRSLGVRYVLEGSVRKVGTRVRITAQLIDGGSGGHLWAERYDRELTDIFAVQDEVARSIVDVLKVTLAPAESHAIGRAPTTNMQAYEYCLRARHYFYQWTKSGWEFARQLFSKVIELDPTYAQAYAGIAECNSLLFMYFGEDRALLDEIRTCSEKALALAPDLAEAHASMGLVFELTRQQYQAAQQEFDTALRLNPNLFQTYHFYARTCFLQGELEKAASLCETAVRMWPDDYNTLGLLRQIYKTLGRHSEAEAVSRRSFEAIERHLQMHPDDTRAIYKGAVQLAHWRERERAFAWAERALSMDSTDILVNYNVACVYSLSGEVEKAIDHLERSVRAGWARKAWIEHDSDLDALRDHPRYRALVGQME